MKEEKDDSEQYAPGVVSMLGDRIKKMQENPESLVEYTFDELKAFIIECFNKNSQ